MRTYIKSRPYTFVATALCAVLGAALGGALWFWSQGDGAEEQGARSCWRVLAELGTDSSGSIGSCGDELEAAMTGKPAGSKPTGTGPVRLADEQSRAFEHVVKAYAAPESGAEKMPSGIRRNMAHAITYYRDDVYEIVSGQVDYSDPRFSTEPNDIDVSRPVMWAFLKGVARDKAAFGLVRESMFDLIEQQVNELQREDFAGEQRGDSDQAIGVARQSGRTVGVLQASRFEGLQGQFGESGAKLEEALADKDYQAYGVPRLGQLFRSRAASLGIRETPESQRRLDDIVSTAEDNYRMRSGFLVP